MHTFAITSNHVTYFYSPVVGAYFMLSVVIVCAAVGLIVLTKQQSSKNDGPAG